MVKGNMKQDLSIPKPIYQAAESLAQKFGISLSELYAVALNAYVTERQKDEITETLNQIYTNEPSALDAELIKMQTVALEVEEW